MTFRILTIGDEARVSLSEGPEDARPPAGGQLRWIDLAQQDEIELALLAERFGFHPLTIEDCLQFDQRPKLESYPGYAFLVLHGFEVDWDQMDEAGALELHQFVGERFLVTVHQEPLAAVDAVWNRIALDGRLAGHGADELCYRVSDELIDSYFPLLDGLLLRVDGLEDRVAKGDESVALSQILAFKRLLLELRRILSAQRDVLALLAKRGDRLVSERVSVYFRDVYDHALRLHEAVESARELIANVRDALAWNASQRTNEIVKRLTILSAVFLPLTFLTGFFGQNFEALPFGSRGLMYAMLAACVVVPGAMLAYFVRSRWF
jgi:magnesium transporter